MKNRTTDFFQIEVTPLQKLLCSLISFNVNESDLLLYQQFNDCEVFDEAKNNLVDSIVAYRLIQYYGENKVAKHWSKSYSDTHLRINTYLNELDNVAHELNKHGIKIIALKNSGIAKGIYQNPGLVPMGDVDTLVSRSDFFKAHAIITNMGYEILAPNKFHSADINTGYREGSSEYIKYLSDSISLRFELLWRTVEGRFLRPEQEPDGDIVISRSVDVENSYVKILSPEDNLLQVCLHTAKHSYVRAPGFRLHLDVDRIVNSCKINWNLFLTNVEKHQVKNMVFYSLAIPTTLFKTPVPEEVLIATMPSKTLKYILSNWIKKAGIFYPEEKKFGKAGYIIWNIVLNGSVKGLVKLALPPVSWMRERYAFSNNLMLPLFYLKRIFNLAFQRVKT